MRAPVLFLHTSPAALAPLHEFYRAEAPDLAVTNLLDDGLLALLASGRHDLVERRLGELLTGARAAYGARAALLTCSSVTEATLSSLRARTEIPVVKIDEGMARAAVSRGSHVGVLATFPPTLEPTRVLIANAAVTAGVQARVTSMLADGAYAALLAGDTAGHDAAVVAAAKRLASVEVDVIVLAQVSTARALPAVQALGVPVLSSLQTSLADLRAALAGGRP